MSLPTVRGEHVAVIDDDADVLAGARMVLKRRFATVLPSNSPQALLDVMAQESEFDALLLDMNFRRGDDRPRPIDVRVIAATNATRDQLTDPHRFRADLYYRLNTVEIMVPPLRERREDIPAMIEQFGGEFARRYGKPSRMADAAAMDALTRDDWPGNVRALRHAVERATILASGHGFNLSDFALVSGHTSSPQPGDQSRGASQPPQTLEEIERAAIASALTRHGGNASHAAAELGITRQSLYRRMEEHGL